VSRTSLLALLALAGVTPAPASDGPLTPRQFEDLRLLVKPQAGESKWAAVPWRTNLDEARRAAAAADRPLLVWRAGGGDVLGRV
jgi:hypothetical protein